MANKIPTPWKFFSKFLSILLLFSLGYNCGFRQSPLKREPGLGPSIPAFASLPESGEYFSEIKQIPVGFYIRQIYLNRKTKQELLISQLTVTGSKNWEETRFEGKLNEDVSGKFLRFRPKLCRMFTSKNAGDRWTLTRAYECDHFEFLLWKAGADEIRLVPGPEGEEDGLLLKKPKSGSLDKVSAIVLKTETQKTSVWGMRLSRVRKGAKGYLEKPDGQKLDLKSFQNVETTGELEPVTGVSPGDFILYTNPNAVNPLAYE